MLDSIHRAASETDKAELRRLEDALRHSEARLERESERLMALHHASTLLAMAPGSQTPSSARFSVALSACWRQARLALSLG